MIGWGTRHGRAGTAAGSLLVALVACLAFAAPATAVDPATGLAEAEARIGALSVELDQHRDEMRAVRASFARARRAEAGPRAAAERARRTVARTREAVERKQRRAQHQIEELHEQRRRAAEDRDGEVQRGIGVGLAALAVGAIALGWGRFRRTRPVRELAAATTGAAVGICAGGGLSLIVLGAILGSGSGAVGALGGLLFWLGIGLPVALLLGRHSLRVAAEEAQPLLGRAALPGWVPLAVAAAMGVVFLAGTGSAILAEEAASDPIPGNLVAAAEGRADAERLRRAEVELERRERALAGPAARREAAQRRLTATRSALRRGQRRLAAAEADRTRFSNRLAALERREAARAAREAEEEEALAVEDEAASGCHPSYTPCLDPDSPDYDCAGGSGDGPDYTGRVEVHGYDEFDLDSDGDGIGCE